MICHACNADFEDYKSLAQHIVSLKDVKHRKGRRWALKFLSKQKILDQKRDFKPRTAMPENIKNHFDEIKRELSGETERVSTLCPNCRTKSTAVLEAEYVNSGVAWVKDDRVVMYCQTCRG